MPALVFGYLIALIVALCAAILAGPPGIASFLVLCGAGVAIVWGFSKHHGRSGSRDRGDQPDHLR